jgi:hypothetical protein
MASKLEQALALAAQGFKVFPIKAGAKAPPLVNDWPALATADDEQIHAWWHSNTQINIGIHCEGLLVVDVDVHKGGLESFKKLDDMLGFPNTRTHGTPTGGLHAIYRLPEGHPGVPNSVGTATSGLAQGLDIRSTGGYIVAPGSQIGDAILNPYHVAVDLPIAPAPDWLVRKLGTFVRRERAEESNVPDASPDALERALAWLQTAERSVKGAGGDQTAYRVACGLRDQGLSYQQACEAMRSESWDWGCGWREGWLEQKPIRSAYKYAQNDAGVKVVSAGMFTALPADAPQNIGKKIGKETRVQLASEMAGEPAANNYVIKRWLSAASYVDLFGAPGEGKTFNALDMAYHVAASKPWMGNRVHGGVVLYLAFEGKGGMHNRIRALAKREADLGKLYVANASMNLRETAGRQELGRVLAELPEKPVLIVIDTFARALMGGDENSAQDVGAFNNAVEMLIEETGACVMIIHHSGKNKAAGARGSSALLGAIDTEIEVDNKQIISRKQREGENPLPIGFTLKQMQLGMDSDNEIITSCVVEKSNVVPGSKPLSGKGQHAFMVLSELTGESNTPVPVTRYVAKLKDEGFGKSAAHEWSRKLAAAGKATINDGCISRRLA